MKRILFALLLAPAPALAVGVVPPIPRIPDAELKPADPPKDDAPKAEPDEDPAKIVERITQTAESVGDKLKDKDTGTDTRKQQEQLLRDIDALLKPPPPMNNGGGGGGGMNDMPPPPMPPPPGGGGMGGGMPPPQGGGGGGRQKQPRGSRGEGQQQPMPMSAGGMNEPMPGGMKPMPMGVGKEPMGTGKEPMQPGGAGANAGGSGHKSPPTLPLDVPITKEVWGHLPEKLRQEVSQYYKEQYLPRYNELLKQYYIALAERERQKKK